MIRYRDISDYDGYSSKRTYDACQRQQFVKKCRPAKSLVTPIRYHTCVQLVSYRKNIRIITNGYAEASNWRIFNSDLDLHVLFVSNKCS